MRRMAILWAWIGLVAATPGRAGAQTSGAGPKIAFIHSGTILAQTPGYAAAESTVVKVRQALQDTVQRMQQQWDSANRAYEQQALALSSTAKQAKQRDLEQMRQRLAQHQNELETRFQQRQQELMQPIQARILGIIEGIRAEGNYALIFDMDAPDKQILTADPSLDLTPKVIERLRQAQ
jgi:outer membrane protein